MEKMEMQKKLDDIVRSDRSFLEKANELRVLYLSDGELFNSLNTDEITTSPLANYIIYEWEREKK
jgi:hypothetical protein